jgi:hypothetical protein
MTYIVLIACYLAAGIFATVIACRYFGTTDDEFILGISILVWPAVLLIFPIILAGKLCM